MTRKDICILSELDERLLRFNGIPPRCSVRAHRHYSRAKVDALVKAGELRWVGKHKRIAAFLNARSWVKVYTRNAIGEVLVCNMQLVRGGGGF